MQNLNDQNLNDNYYQAEKLKFYFPMEYEYLPYEENLPIELQELSKEFHFNSIDCSEAIEALNLPRKRARKGQP